LVTPGLYALIFKRLLDEAVFTEDNKQTYKSILLTNAHRRNHSVHKPIMSNKGCKYKYIIDLFVFIHKTNGRKSAGIISSIMRLTDNKIDYVH